MKINFLGDSITEGLYSTSKEKSYVFLVGETLNAEVRNYGKCCARLTKRPVEFDDGTQPNINFTSIAETMDHNADLVVVFGGTNDYGPTNAPLGEMGDKTRYTVYGAVDYLINYLLQHYKKEQILFVSPLYREDENIEKGNHVMNYRGPLSKIRIAIEETCKKYGIEYLDIKDEFGKAEGNNLLEDGLHPNDEGHKLLADLISKKIKSTGMC